MHLLMFYFSLSKIIILSHAGYRYCGATAAYAYKEINNEKM